MSLYSWGHIRWSTHFQYNWSSTFRLHAVATQHCCIFRHLASSLNIVATYISGIVVHGCDTVVEDNGDVFVASTLQTAIQSMKVIRRNHEQVDTLINEAINLPALAFVAIVGILYNHLNIGVIEMLCR